MGLSSILAAVEKRVVEVVGKRGDRVPNFGFGENAKYKTEALPRVTWVPLQGPIGKVANNRANADQAARQLWNRSLQIQARIWADDYDAVEALAAHVFAAFTFVRNANYGLVSEAWDTSGSLKRGVLAVFIVRVDMPFTDEPSKTVDGTETPLGTDLSEEMG